MKEVLNFRTLVASLFIGLLVSALWENLFRSVLNFSAQGILTLSTLGIERYRDDIYLTIAKGFYEQASIEMLSLGFGLLFGAAAAVILIKPLRKNESDTENKPSLISKWLGKHDKTIRILMLIYFFSVMGMSILDLTKLTYINKSIAYYHQLTEIAAPYLSQEQLKIFDSKYAQIKNKNDYLVLTNELKSILDENQQFLPKPPSFIF